MKLIQLLLAVSILTLGAIYFIRFRSKILDKLIILIFLALGVFFILFPQTTSNIANYLGVGRGTDLLLYISLILVCFILLLLYSKIRTLNQNMTTIIRNEAIEKARQGNNMVDKTA